MRVRTGDRRPPATAPVVLTLDYPGAGERGRLARLAEADPGIELIPLLGEALPRSLDAASYAGQLLDRWTAPDRPVGAVVAYCMAAPIGHEVTRLLGSRQGSHPTFLAIDGSPCPAWFVDAVFRDIIHGPEQTTPTSTSAEITEAHLRDDPAAVVARMERDLTALATRNLLEEFGESMVTTDIVRGFVDMSLNWLTHLTAAHNAAFPPWDGEAILLASREAPFQGPWPGARTSRTVKLDRARADVFDHPDVWRHIRDAVAAPVDSAASAADDQQPPPRSHPPQIGGSK